MEDTPKKLLIAGNIVFVLWITYNGIDEGFSGTIVEKCSYIALVSLLLGNAFVLNKKSGA
jgi:hypothetical protein